MSALRPRKRSVLSSFVLGLLVLILSLAQGGPWPALAAIGRGIGVVRLATPETLTSDILPLEIMQTPTPAKGRAGSAAPPTRTPARAAPSNGAATAATAWTFADEKLLDAMQPMIVATLKARELAFSGSSGKVLSFYPGEGYEKLWARDLSTILPAAQFLYGDEYLRSGVEELLARQYGEQTRSADGDNGVIAGAGALPGVVAPDGTIEKDTATSDEETSVIHAAYQYYKTSGGVSWLKKNVAGRAVIDRLNAALDWLYRARLDATRGLIKRGHTTDWGDVKFELAVQPTDIDPRSDHWTASIYDQALTYRALRQLAEMNQALGNERRAQYLLALGDNLRRATDRQLWMPERGYYRLHVHVTPLTHHDVDEDGMLAIGNAVAIHCGLTTPEQAQSIIRRLEEARLAANALKPGLSLYPAYPANFFATVQRGRGEYQNGGLWDWWGGIQISAEFQNGQSALALMHLQQVATDWARHPSAIWEWSLPMSSFGRGSQGYAGAAATMAEAIIQGLYGVHITRDGVRLEPKLGTHNGQISATQPATGRSAVYEYTFAADRIALRYTVNGSGDVQFRVLIPSGRLAAAVVLDGRSEITPKRETVGADVFAAFKAPTGSHELVIVLRAGQTAGGAPAIDAAFLDYYQKNDGPRLLGAALAAARQEGPRRVQYFEKGKLEDHRQSTHDPVWQFSYGLLGEEIVRLGANLPVGGEKSTVTYALLKEAATEDKRVPPPKGYAGAVFKNRDGTVFIPFSADLKAAPGHNVAAIFWVVLSSDSRSPGGWLHDVGLPLTEAVWATVERGELKNRRVLIQAFQRTILVYDPQNTPGWQVERYNIGVDWLKLRLQTR